MSARFVMPFADVGSGITPSSGSKLFFFESDGVTPKDTHTTKAATVANANPVIADSTGVFPSIYITGDYLVTLKDKNNSQIFGLAPINEFAAVTDAAFVKNFATLAAAIADTGLVDGDTFKLTNDRGNSDWNVVLKSTVTISPLAPDVANVVEHAPGGTPDDLAFDLEINNNSLPLSNIGAIDNIGTDIFAAAQLGDDLMQPTRGIVVWDVSACRLDSTLRVGEGVTHDPAGHTEIVTSDLIDDAIVIGKVDKSSNFFSKWLKGFELRRLSREWDTGVDNSSIAITLVNCIHCEAHVETERYNIGVRLFGDTAGCVFNDVKIVLINDCRFGIDLSDETNVTTGFVNSNRITGAGEITYRSSTVSAANGNNIVMRNINVSNNGFANNNNTFESFGMKLNNSLEVNNYNPLSAMVVDNGQFNDYTGLRWEEFGSDSAFFADQWVIWASQSKQNRIIGGRVTLEPHIADHILDNSTSIHEHKLIGFDTRQITAKIDSDQAIADSVGVFVLWDSVSSENITQKWFDAGEPEKLTVPKNVFRIHIVATVSFQGDVTTALRRIQLFKNTALADQGFVIQTTDNSTRTVIGTASMDVVEGDFLRLQVRQETGSSLNLEILPQTRIHIDVIE